MRFAALACDYDGTLASHDRIGPETITALARAREVGLHLILVTGRTFFELLRVCERLDLFDAVVAENGAVLHFPSTGSVRDLAPPPPPRLLAELDRRGISVQAGRVILGVTRGDAGPVRETLDALGIRMDLVTNRAALMLLPSGVSKGSGVRQAISALGLSFQDVLAIGDAENDLDLFDVCGWAACPANAVEVVKTRADWVFAGDDGAAIADAITSQVLAGRLPVRRSLRHHVVLGWVREDLEPIGIPERGVNVLIDGDSLSGKSWLAGLLVERLHERRYGVCVVDPEGDYHVLGSLAGASVMTVRRRRCWEQALARFDADPSACLVLDLSALGHEEKVALVETGLALLRQRRLRGGPPHWVVLDEAHYTLHPEGVADAVADLEDRGFCLVTYHASWLRPSVLRAIDLVILGRTTASGEHESLGAWLGEGTVDRPECSAGGVDALAVLPSLPLGEFLLLRRGDLPGPRAATFVPAPRLTRHVRHVGKYADGRLPPEHAFLFRAPNGQLVATAASLGAFLGAVGAVDDAVLAHHASRHDLSRWLLDVFAARELGGQIAKLERRWSRGEVSGLRPAIQRLIATALEPGRARATSAETP